MCIWILQLHPLDCSFLRVKVFFNLFTWKKGGLSCLYQIWINDLWILRHPKFSAPDLCTLCHLLLLSLWWDAIPVIRLLISSLWLNQEGGYPGWTWLSEMSHVTETEASERYSPVGPEKSGCPAVKTTGPQNNGWLLGAEGLRFYEITRHWMLPVINEFGNGLQAQNGIAVPANAFILSWRAPEQRTKLISVWAPHLETKINDVLYCWIYDNMLQSNRKLIYGDISLCSLQSITLNKSDSKHAHPVSIQIMPSQRHLTFVFAQLWKAYMLYIWKAWSLYFLMLKI